MERLHRQAILDCYEDITRDMDPNLVLRYSTVRWRDEDPGFIRAKERTEGPHSGARALLDKLLDLPYDGFDDFVQSLGAVPYDHLVEQLLDTRTRLRTRVERGEIRMRDLGRRRQDTTFTSWTLSILLATVGILVAIVAVWALSSGTKETSLMTVFPRRLKTFVGREDVFGKIDACLEQNQTCLIKGLGGVGKTTVAIEYAHRRANVYDGTVFWVRSATTRDLCASISQYILYLNGRGEEYVLSRDDLGCKSVKMHFREYLTNTKLWLLVVDEVSRETMKELGSLLPHSPTRTMHILLTSHEYQRLDMERISVVTIPPFNNTEALAMFNKTVRPSYEDDKREIESLSRSLGHHPLALQFAYSYISATGCSIKDYHAKYIAGNATQKVDLLDKVDIEQSTKKKVRQTFQITFQYVSNLSANAAKLLNMTSFMGPDCIPCPKPNSKRFAGFFNSARQLDKLDTIEMVSVLERFSLASHCHFFQPCGFSVNRIVQDVIVAEMNESLRLFHLQNAMTYSTLFLRNTKHTSRVQAEFLMSHVHYVALNLETYQTRAPFPAYSIFLNRSAEYFCRWGACEEAYLFLPVEMLLLFKHAPIQDLSCHLLNHINFLRNRLLPCLYKGDTPVDLLVNIADTLYWEAAEIDHMYFSSKKPASCDIFDVFTTVLNTSSNIYKRLFQSKQPRYLDYFKLSVPYLMSVSSYIEETPFDELENLFIPSPKPNTTPEEYWKGMYDMVSYAGGVLHPEGNSHYLDDLPDFSFLKDVHEASITRCIKLLVIDVNRDILQYYRKNIQKVNKVVSKLLFMYYRFMVTDSCTNRYYEVMLGLPRESKQFDILTFAHDNHQLLGDPGVVKSVLSLSSTQNPKFRSKGKNLHPDSISPISYFEFHAEVRLKYKQDALAHQLSKTTDQAKTLGKTTLEAECKAVTDAVHFLERDRKDNTWKQLDNKYDIVSTFLDILDSSSKRCHFLKEKKQMITNFKQMSTGLANIISSVRSYLNEKAQDIEHPFATVSCTFACPAFRAVFNCESSFPYIMWVWKRLQEMLRYLDCFSHGLICCNKFVDVLGTYLNSTIFIDLTSKQNSKEMLFGEPLSDGGSNFHFVQKEGKVIGIFHKIRGVRTNPERPLDFEQDINLIVVEQKPKTP